MVLWVRQCPLSENVSIECSLMFILVHVLAEGIEWLWGLFVQMCLFGCSGTWTVLIHTRGLQHWGGILSDGCYHKHGKGRYYLLKTHGVVAFISDSPVCLQNLLNSWSSWWQSLLLWKRGLQTELVISLSRAGQIAGWASPVSIPGRRLAVFITCCLHCGQAVIICTAISFALGMCGMLDSLGGPVLTPKGLWPPAAGRMSGQAKIQLTSGNLQRQCWRRAAR